jgi:hypothetical protein
VDIERQPIPDDGVAAPTPEAPRVDAWEVFDLLQPHVDDVEDVCGGGADVCVLPDVMRPAGAAH